MSGDSDEQSMEVDPPANFGGNGSTAEENALAASGTTPMANRNPLYSETGSIGNENPLNIGTGPFANENPLNSGTPPITNEGAVMASAEPQENQQDLYTAQGHRGCMLVEVDWPKEITENKKRKVELQKAIQSLLNKHTIKADCSIEDLKNEHSAVVWVTPSSAMDVLFREDVLMFKSWNTKAKVRFSFAPSQNTDRLQNEKSLHTTAEVYPAGMAQSVHKEKTANTSFGKSSVEGPLKKEELNRKVYRSEEEPASRHDSVDLNAGNESATFNQGEAQVEKKTFTVPLFQYWHITTACSKEMDQIRRNNGVDIEGQALVSITPQVHKESQGSALIAEDEFTNLFQKFAQEIGCITVPVTSLDQSHMMEMLKEIQTEERNLVMSVSSKGCQISGPRESLDRFQRKWKLESRPQDSKGTLPKTLDMNLRDPLEKQGLAMDPLHWEFIRTVFKKQVMAIKQKFGVDFAKESAAGMFTIKAVQVGDQRFLLACHALKALEQLYQKGATDIMVCPLENPIPDNDEQIKNAFKTIRPRYPCVATWDTNGLWRLVGLAKHLRAAVKEMESLLGEPVFSEKAKQQLQCPEPSPATSEGATGSQAGVSEEEKCPICFASPMNDKKKLNCKHEFCSGCLQTAVEYGGPCCPVCREVYGEMEGDQPAGHMKYQHRSSRLPGFYDCGSIEIEYDIPGGMQTKKHPKPGKPFSGTRRYAYLPDNHEGNEVLMLLQKAFDQKLIFTVGISNTTGASDTVTWNDIHHKTNIHGGPQSYGYPDPDYLKRVKEELKAKGIK